MLEIYGTEHIVFLIIVIPLMIASMYMVKRFANTPKKLSYTVKVIGILFLASILWNRISTSIFAEGWQYFLPSSYCGMSSFALSISLLVLKKDHPIFHCVIYISLLGGLLTLIYPDFIVNSSSIFYQPTISGLLHHSFLVFVPLMLVYTNYVKPELKKYYILPLGMASYITFGVFEITVLNYSDAMYLFEPVLEGTMFNWFGFTLLFLPTHLLFLIIWRYLPIRYKPSMQ